MPRFTLPAGLCLAAAVLCVSAVGAQTELASFPGTQPQGYAAVGQHPLVAPLAKPTPLPTTMDDTTDEAPQPVSADPAVLPPQVEDPTYYTDEQEGAFRRLIRYYRHLMAPKYCFCEMFVKGQWSASFIAGYIPTPFNWFGIRIGGGPRLDFVPLNVRLQRVMIGNNGDRRFFKGSTEAFLEFTNMPISRGSGTFLIGGTAGARYNFSYTRRRMIPYVQFGGGVIYSDSWTGGAGATNLVAGVNYVLHAAYGSKFFINRRWSFDTETSFYHFSNAGVTPPNVSVNGIGGLFGLTYYFGQR